MSSYDWFYMCYKFFSTTSHVAEFNVHENKCTISLYFDIHKQNAIVFFSKFYHILKTVLNTYPKINSHYYYHGYLLTTLTHNDLEFFKLLQNVQSNGDYKLKLTLHYSPTNVFWQKIYYEITGLLDWYIDAPQIKITKQIKRPNDIFELHLMTN